MDDYPAADDPIPNMSESSDGRYGELVRFLTESQSMRQTAKSALKQSLWAGGGALTGAFLMGPVGGLVGGIVGSVVGFFKSDDYDGAILAIVKLDDEHKKALMTEVAQVLTVAGATAQQLQSADAFYAVLSQYAEQEAVRDGVWRACLHSIQS